MAAVHDDRDGGFQHAHIFLGLSLAAFGTIHEIVSGVYKVHTLAVTQYEVRRGAELLAGNVEVPRVCGRFLPFRRDVTVATSFLRQLAQAAEQAPEALPTGDHHSPQRWN